MELGHIFQRTFIVPINCASQVTCLQKQYSAHRYSASTSQTGSEKLENED